MLVVSQLKGPFPPAPRSRTNTTRSVMWGVVIAQSYAKEIREGCVRGYALSVKRWFVQAEKYAKTHGQVQLRHSNASSLKDGISGDGSVEDGGAVGGGAGEGGEAKKGNRLKMSGRVVRVVVLVRVRVLLLGYR